MENQNPPERIKKLIFALTVDSRLLTDKDFEFVKTHIEKFVIRAQLSDFLMSFTSPRNVREEKCLEMLGEIIKIVIDVI